MIICRTLKNQPVLTAFFLLILTNVYGQAYYEGPIPESYLKLQETRPEIRDNDLLNEEIIDLVEVQLSDSNLLKKTERHRVFLLGWVVNVFGYKWRSIDMRKSKYVGTAKREARVPSDDIIFTEYDVNMDIYSNIDKYLDLSWSGRQYQLHRNKQMRKKMIAAPPYIEPDKNGNRRPYSLHCELTPPEGYRAMLNEKFYPCQQPNSFAGHENFGSPAPSVGLYGAFVADCNHSCHPEIHPYEWIWWYDLHPKRDSESNQSWFIGMFKEGSNRFPHWSKGPREGTISIPFLFDADRKDNSISIEHLVFSKMDTVGLKNKFKLPEDAFTLDFKQREKTLAGFPVTLKLSNPMTRNGILAWFSDVTYDNKRRMISGRLNLAARAEEVYTAKVSFE
jgi:hypothetical protein